MRFVVSLAKLSSAVAILILVLASPVRAGSEAFVPEDPAFTEAVYKETVRLCRDFSTGDALNFAYASGSEMLGDLRLLRPSVLLETIVGSYGFQRGLQTCYGDNKAYRAFFISSLVIADVSGKCAGLVATVGLAKAFSWALGRISITSPLTGKLLLTSSVVFAATETVVKAAEKLSAETRAERESQAWADNPGRKTVRTGLLLQLEEKERMLILRIHASTNENEKMRWQQLLVRVRQSIKTLKADEEAFPQDRAAG